MSEVTRILNSIESGEAGAAQELLPLVYDELRRLAASKMAQEKPGQTLQATALVHEAWISGDWISLTNRDAFRYERHRTYWTDDGMQTLGPGPARFYRVALRPF